MSIVKVKKHRKGSSHFEFKIVAHFGPLLVDIIPSQLLNTL